MRGAYRSFRDGQENATEAAGSRREHRRSIGVVGSPPTDTLAAIFASIRTGEAPWSIDELPTDTGATAVLLSELDRLWQNPAAQLSPTPGACAQRPPRIEVNAGTRSSAG